MSVQTRRPLGGTGAASLSLMVAWAASEVGREAIAGSHASGSRQKTMYLFIK